MLNILAKSNHMTLAPRGSPLIPQLSPEPRVSRRTCHAPEHLGREARGGPSPQAGRASARAVRLSGGPASRVVVGGQAPPDRPGGGPVLLAPQGRPSRAGLSPTAPGAGTRRPG